MDEEDAVTSTDNCDSDLFFDFDIGSPDHIESDEDHNVVNVVNGMDLTNGNDSSDISPSLIGPTSDHIPTLIRSPDHSTAYGSTSSGLFSDPDTPSPSDVDENDRLEEFVEGFSLHPEDWLKTQQSIFARMETNNKSSSVTPTMSPHTRSPPAEITPLIILPPDLTPPDSTDGIITNEKGDEVEQGDDESLEEDSASRDDSSSLSDDIEADKEVKFCIGSQEKSVANSKLQLLLAQLEKGKSYSLPDKNTLKVKKEIIKTPALSSSPANFSYLVGSLPSSEMSGMSSLARSIKSHSTPDMSEYDKLRCTSMSPRPDDGSTEQLAIPIIEVQVIES